MMTFSYELDSKLLVFIDVHVKQILLCCDFAYQSIAYQ